MVMEQTSPCHVYSNEGHVLVIHTYNITGKPMKVARNASTGIIQIEKLFQYLTRLLQTFPITVCSITCLFALTKFLRVTS